MFQISRLAAAAALLPLLAACTASRPPPRVEAAAPPQWLAPLPHNGRLADLRAWWQQLDDPLLVQLVDAAQQVSPTVATAATRVAQARATRTAARAALQPAVDASAAVSRGNTQQPLVLASVAQVGAQASWEIDVFGGRRLAAQGADARLAGADAQWHEARVSVAADTAQAYVDLRSCQRQLLLAESDAASRGETARLAGLSAEAGFTAPASAALARGSAAEAAARATQQRALCEVGVKGLVALAGLPEPVLREQLNPPWTAAHTLVLPQIQQVPAQLLAQRPDVYRAQQEVAAASADVGTARADRYPRLGLSGSIAAGQVRLGGQSSAAQTWSIGPLALSLPLWDGGRRAANVQAAETRYEEAVVVYRASVRQAVREVEQALVNLDSAAARVQDARSAVEGYQASFDGTDARYRAGLASLVELEEGRRNLLAAQTSELNLQREQLAAWVALYRALGGGWNAPVAPGVAAR